MSRGDPDLNAHLATEAAIVRLRAELHAAGYPPVYAVDRETFETIEAWLERLHAQERARWHEAGEPDTWPRSMTLMTRTGEGFLFRGCEIVIKPTPELCTVCGLPLEVGDWPCVTTIRPHGKSVQTSAFAAYFDQGLGREVTGLGDRHAAMREKKLDYRDKMSPGDLSARNDRIHEKLVKAGREVPR